MKKKVILIKILKHVPQNWPGLQAHIYTLEKKNTVISILGGFSFWDDEILSIYFTCNFSMETLTELFGHFLVIQKIFYIYRLKLFCVYK